MGYIKEPDGIDFVIQSKPLTKKEEIDLSDYIAKRKIEIISSTKKVVRTKHSV